MPLEKRKIEDGPIVLGICAMKKKASSEPMRQAVDRLRAFEVTGHKEFQVVYFDEEMILNQPVEEWPVVDALIAFFSTGFPLDKAIAYVSLRKPFVFNDLDKQKWLFDRRQIYKLLSEAGVPVAKHVVMNAGEANEVEESEDYLEVNGVRISKPLVEKPVSGEDHNIYIYYPRSQGGGSKRLFRKVKDRSSQFYPGIHTTRVHDGNSYIYEELLQTEGTDVKVYAIGPEYAHAEARKSPVVDGKVKRNVRGKEERYPVILDAEEKVIARKVVITFGQTVCGFDLLRSNGKTYVCDVNGWSFVKDSHKFWSDSANLLRQYMLEAIAPAHLRAHPEGNQLVLPDEAPAHRTKAKGDKGRRRNGRGAAEREEALRTFATPPNAELLCVVALTRHGDRTPKEKLKFSTREPLFLSMITEHSASTVEELKIKNVKLMEEITSRVCQVVTQLTQERKLAPAAAASTPAPKPEEVDDDFEKLLTVRQVLTSHPFRGINRKVQLKPTRWERQCSTSGGDDGAASYSSELRADGGPEPGATPTEAQFILKWGGELTPLGESQAERLGTIFRKTLYPGEFGGVLRLHATYRHDMKIYTSEEGRVQMTAAAFAKGFLDLDGNLTPILASLVSKNEKVTQMLDETPDAGRAAMELAKVHIHKVLSLDQVICDECNGLNDMLPPALSTGSASPAARAPADNSQAAGGGGGGGPETPARVAPPPSAESPFRSLSLSHLSLGETPAASRAGGVSRSPLIAAAPTASSLLVRSLRSMGNPKQALCRLRDLLDELVRELKVRAAAAAICGDEGVDSAHQLLNYESEQLSERLSGSDRSGRASPELGQAADEGGGGEGREGGEETLRWPANGETPHLQLCRWSKLRKDLYKAKKDKFDTTKVPDVYDNAMYDVVHNEHLGLAALPELYRVAHTLASYVVPQEYGIEKHDKVHIGLEIGSVLLRKIHHDLLSGTSPQEHEQERVHQLDSSHNTVITIIIIIYTHTHTHTHTHTQATNNDNNKKNHTQNHNH
ncbi:histidine phosphatase superfamily-domain-containing protein [Pavlovales sp. CCMP2436]|nr:histidine phosphatase superfamily-domain-containing protein [Pavlovales sp. CCMP2436]